MKKTTIAALCIAQWATLPAFAAELPSDRIEGRSQFGAFAGARLRVPLGKAKERKVRAILTVAPVATGQQADGKMRTRFAEGIELGFSGESKVGLALGGQPVSRLGPGGSGPEGRKLGVGTTEWLAVGVGVVVLVVGGLYLWADSQCGEDCN